MNAACNETCALSALADETIIAKAQWYLYEKQCIAYHRQQFPQQIVYHWEDIPEDILIESGFLRSNREARQARKQLYLEHGTYRNHVREYGLDGIAFSICNNTEYQAGEADQANQSDSQANEATMFFGIQAKCYQTNTYLCAKHLGTFYQCILRMNALSDVETRGVVYYTCRLQSDLKKDLEIFAKSSKTSITSYYLPFDDSEVSRQQQTKESDDGGFRCGDPFRQQQTENRDYCGADSLGQIVLRDYQQIAVASLIQFCRTPLTTDNHEKVGLLDMPCGTGKTVVLGVFLQQYCGQTDSSENIKTETAATRHTVVVISPYRSLVKQSLDRLSAVLPNFAPLLVDCDYTLNATRSSSDVLKHYDQHEHVLISATYRSAQDVLVQVFEQLPDNQILFIVDEAHNLQNNETLIGLCRHRAVHRTILMTATPPNTMKTGVISSQLVYQYTMQEAIQNKHICDYRIYLPLETIEKLMAVDNDDHDDNNDDDHRDDHEDHDDGAEKEVNDDANESLRSAFESDLSLASTAETDNYDDIPMEIQDVFKNKEGFPEVLSHSSKIIKMAMYLINGMLKTGSRKCIAYFKTIHDCSAFCTIFQKVTQHYHFMESWTSSITADTPAETRRNILGEFSSTLCVSVLCSVRILDEGIDIPSCDAVFLSNVHESSCVVRTVQRICRANRLDHANPNKIANVFMWASENVAFLNALKLLRENDEKHFESKLRGLSVQYEAKAMENSGSQDAYSWRQERCATAEKIETFCQWFAVKAMSLTELWNYRAQQFAVFIHAEQRIPARREVFKTWRIGTWLSIQKTKVKDCESAVYIALSDISPLLREELDRYLSAKEMNQNKETYTWEEQLALCAEFIHVEQRIPAQREVFKSWRIGAWLNHQKMKVKDCECAVYIALSAISPLLREELDRYLSAKENKKTYTWEEQLALCDEFMQAEQRIPAAKEVFKSWRIGTWLNHQKKKVKDCESAVYIALSAISPLLREELDRYLSAKEMNQNKETYTWEEQLALCAEFIHVEQRIPAAKEVFKSWRIGLWLNTQKQKVKDCECAVYIALSAISPLLREELDRYLSAKEINQNKKTYTWEEQLALCAEFIHVEQRIPAAKEVFKSWRIGQWLNHQKAKVKDCECAVYIALSDISPLLREELDRYLCAKEKTYTWDEQLALCAEFIHAEQRIPARREVFKSWRIGLWLSNQKMKVKDCECAVYIALSAISPLLCEKLDRYLSAKKINQNKKTYTWEEQLALCAEFMHAEQRIPAAKEVFKSWRIGAWLSNQKTKVKDCECAVYIALSAISPLLREELDRYLCAKENTKATYTWDEQLALCAEFIHSERRIPSYKEVFKSWRIGQWLTKQKSKITDCECAVYNALSAISPLLQAELDRYICAKEVKKNKK